MRTIFKNLKNVLNTSASVTLQVIDLDSDLCSNSAPMACIEPKTDAIDSSQSLSSSTNISDGRGIQRLQERSRSRFTEPFFLSRTSSSEHFDVSQAKQVLRVRSFSQHDLGTLDLKKIQNVELIEKKNETCHDSSPISTHHKTEDTSLGGIDSIERLSSSTVELWKGRLYKRSTGLVGSWQLRSFRLTTQPFIVACKKIIRPVLSYQSKTKGEHSLVIKDVRREQHLDDRTRVCISVSLVSQEVTRSLLDLGQLRVQERALLMTMTDMDAVALLTCLRRILEPGRALPTPWDMMHFPGQALDMLA
jgi:hypothetical protein